ncbi:efflux RND transporter permease subunit [Hydrogenophilus thermoluteolus]|jgi:multidrug efflux pump subunit AcrB|nr:efflux RND transporter permease subunit [Hydrogenophilus thermoluteolus]MBW7657633.1 efflux RND transporter permease subunit [Hydrogenophilus thermoluteolus]
MSGFVRRLLENGPLANLAFLLVVALGVASYLTMPRARDPEINFNWVNVWTVYPGASAEDVARKITEPLEEALRTVSDIRYLVSTSREGLSSILVRFERLDDATFARRVEEVRREVLNKANDLPETAKTPRVMEITTSNGFPTAMLALYGPVGGETLRATAERIKRDLEHLPGVDRALVFGFREPELQIRFDPIALAALGVAPVTLADQVRAWFRDLAAGRVRIAGEEWLARVQGETVSAEALAQLPIQVARTNDPVPALLPLSQLAEVQEGAERARQLVRFHGHPALLVSITKKAKANTLQLLDALNRYIDEHNSGLEALGLRLALVDDQTPETRAAIGVMEQNALVGLALVLVMVGFFLGRHLALLVAAGMVFALAGAMAVLAVSGSTLNLTVLLGVVIALGMLVDDAVVIVEAIHDKIVQGVPAQQAVFAGLREVAAPVASAVLTTVAAFLPLMLLPGILGDFLRVVPVVVTVALAMSLVEAYWLLPAHILTMHAAFDRPRSRWGLWRERFQRRLRNRYGRWLVWALRRPKRAAVLAFLAFAAAVALVVSGTVRVQFFAFETIRLFYIHADLPVGTPLSETLAVADRMRQAVEATLPAEELRAAVAMAGVKFTDTEPLYADHHAQVIVSLNPRTPNGRSTEAVIDALRDAVTAAAKPYTASFLIVKGGPPAQRPVSVKVRSDDDAARDAVVALVKEWLRDIPGVKDIQDDQAAGRPTMELRWRPEALADANLDVVTATRTAALLADGEYVGETRRGGETWRVIVQAKPVAWPSVPSWLDLPIVTPAGGAVPLSVLADVTVRETAGVVRRYQYTRSVTVEAELDRTVAETQAVNAELLRRWQAVAAQYPNVTLDFTGELDDIKESLAALQKIFLVGVGLIYLILATQFRSYVQPLVILVTVPLAFTGVVFGLAASGLPLSLYTMYGVVALTGIAVNSAIVLVAAVNDRRSAGMSPIHAVVTAARRRIVPILITSGTTIGGLFSLATGLAGHSLLWGPVASSIVWGLGVSTILTLFVVPLLLLALLRGQAKRVAMV